MDKKNEREAIAPEKPNPILMFFPAETLKYEYHSVGIDASFYFTYNESENKYYFDKCDYNVQHSKYTLSDFIAIKHLAIYMDEMLKNMNKFLESWGFISKYAK